MGSGRARARLIALAVAVFGLLALPAIALAAFPGTDPDESPRVNTPNDPEFDRCEADDEQTGLESCTTYFDEEFRLFGFSPDSARSVPDPVGVTPHYVNGTRYANCDQLNASGRAANLKAEGLAPGDPGAALAECLQISGIRADSAWKYSTGSPDVSVAILDTGIRWQSPELAAKVALNAAELPAPQTGRSQPTAGATPCASFGGGDDANGDGAFDVTDFACDERVAIGAGDDEADGLLDGSDLIATFSEGTDADSNGYVDDIAGWDFFDDDNDPYDASSCCSASGHGTGRATEAVGDTDNATAGAGVCPECQVIPVRVWDSFVVPTDQFAMGVVYATDRGASVVEGAVGGLTNTRFARESFEYADSEGVALTLVSSDINSANHNYPTNYDQAIYVGGAFPDSAPLEGCTGPGGLPGLGDLPIAPPDEFADGCSEFLDLLGEGGVSPTAQPITTSFFRNSNLTQYGGKADIVLMGATGSENTGQASGAAALLASYGREVFGDDDPLSGNEIRQLLTMTAEDVLPENTGTIGQPDKASPGWDPHFGYGRVDLASAMERIEQERIPPEAELGAPDWFAPINVDRIPASGVEVEGLAAAPHSDSGVGDWELEYACGQDALDSEFEPIPGDGISGSGAIDGTLGTLPRSMLTSLANSCDGQVADDAGRPAGAPDDGAWPADPYPDPDPERHTFQIRLTVHEAGDPENIGRYRKTLHAYNDDGNLAGWPKPVGSGSDADELTTGSGGEASPRLFDVDGDNELDVLIATSSGELGAFHSDGTPVESFNGGEPVRTGPLAIAEAHGVPSGVETPGETLRVPAIGDVDGDLVQEIVAAAGERVYAWELDGSVVDGFPVRIDPALSEPCLAGAPEPCFDPADRAIDGSNHIKRGIFGSPALADLDDDGSLDIVVGALDQHLYAWNGAGEPLDGFPAKLATEGADGAEIIASPAIAQLDGEGPPEVVIATNEVVPGEPEAPGSIFDLLNAFVGSSTGSNPVYAVHGDGTLVDGWPVDVGVLAGDVLPFVVPGNDAAVLDVDDDGTDEVSVSAATSISGQGPRLVDGAGDTVTTYSNAVAQSPDQGPVVNLADYASVGDLTGSGAPAILKGGLTLNALVNLLAVNQNLPFSHVEQAWDPQTGSALPGYPLPTDDFQLLSQASIAQVGGAGPERQALVGTGLYQVHAYGPQGAEPEGWPKFTGGWNQVTPAVGDADGDGDLDVASLTREGWSFLWDTGVDACEGSNDEWWTYHHDEFSTNAYGTDARPPGTPTGLEAERSGDGASASFIAAGDDWLCGRAEKVRVLVSDEPIDSPGDGSRAGADRDVTVDPGSRQTLELTADQVGDARYAAVLLRDEAGNWGRVADVKLPRGGDPGSRRCTRVVRGTQGRDLLVGSPRSDLIRGRGGADRIGGLKGPDCIFPGQGKDRVNAGAGNDRIRARGGSADVIDCGGGRDVATIGPNDRVRRCERVKRPRRG
ncbi:S8 family serine peptidase [Thermoleophilia bacterium SCSIO 60948]|nr:S8 family serine peptidase [Thermoleophilia bacterium SCSIO 60948]